MEGKPISVKLQPKTIERLKKLKHPGQSWDGLINELMDKLKKGSEKV
jgi:predicted CopG family antitoxin